MMDNINIEKAAENSRCLLEARSAIGGRTEQQDRVYAYINEKEILAVVCDGMGGAADGGIASETAISVIRNAYADYLTSNPKDDSSFLYHMMTAADHEVSERMEHKVGGTTLTAIIIRDDCLHWLSVGDSRLYIMRAGELLQVTRDHNYRLRLIEMLEKGKISTDLYKKAEKRGEALISFIGVGGITLFDLTQVGFVLQSKDILLLATDGLFRVFPPDMLKEIISSNIDLSAKADYLLEKTLCQVDKSAQDNTSFILIDIL